MSPQPIQLNAAGIDLSPRVFTTATVVASPTAATEVIIASITLSGDLSIISGALLQGFAAFTVGASGVNANLRIRRTSVAGTVVKATGATNGGALAAAELTSRSINAFDTGATATMVYVLTLEVGSAAAGSTVSAVTLTALVV